jgi:hypothetical protein
MKIEIASKILNFKGEYIRQKDRKTERHKDNFLFFPFSHFCLVLWSGIAMLG